MEFLFLYLIGGLFSFVYFLLSYKIQHKKIDSDVVAIATLSIYTSILSLLFMISSDITTIMRKKEKNKMRLYNKILNSNYKSLKEIKSINDIGWCEISKFQILSEDFIREFQNRVNWGYISVNQKLSDGFIGEFKNKINWTYISYHQNLSKNFIRKFANKVDWIYISNNQKLSEDFIREFQYKVDWYCISKYQKLSENFIREFQDKIDWLSVSKYQKLSLEFIKEFDLDINKNNWLYKNTDFKKKQIVDCGLYECHEDYFIAYKAIRIDRYSHYNFQYQYLPNEVYECHCDCTNEDNSFGLSVWTYEGAKNYYNNRGLIVKVKVMYEDVGRLVHNSNKIRCSKIEILE